MKYRILSALMLGALALPAFAGSRNETLTLNENVTVGTTKLPAGEYKMTLTGTGSNVQVVLVQKTVPRPATVTFNATMTEAKNRYTSVTLDNKSGVEMIKSIDLPNGTVTPNAIEGATGK